MYLLTSALITLLNLLLLSPHTLANPVPRPRTLSQAEDASTSNLLTLLTSRSASPRFLRYTSSSKHDSSNSQSNQILEVAPPEEAIVEDFIGGKAKRSGARHGVIDRNTDGHSKPVEESHGWNLVSLMSRGSQKPLAPSQEENEAERLRLWKFPPKSQSSPEETDTEEEEEQQQPDPQPVAIVISSAQIENDNGPQPQLQPEHISVWNVGGGEVVNGGTINMGSPTTGQHVPLKFTISKHTALGQQQQKHTKLGISHNKISPTSEQTCRLIAEEAGCLLHDLAAILTEQNAEGITLPTNEAVIVSSNDVDARANANTIMSNPVETSRRAKKIEETITMALNTQPDQDPKREIRATLTLLLTHLPQTITKIKTNLHSSSQQASLPHHPCSSTIIPAPQFHSMITLLTRAAESVWEDVIGRGGSTGIMAGVEMRGELDGVGMHARWEFYEVVDGMISLGGCL